MTVFFNQSYDRVNNGRITSISVPKKKIRWPTNTCKTIAALLN